MLCHSCGITKPQPTVITIVKDSVRTEIHERIVHDTVDFVPPEFYERHETLDTLSVIENDYARTAAVVHDGILSHDLQMKKTVIRIPVAVPVHDTVTVESHESQETLTEYVEVEKKLTGWQKTLMGLGKFALFLIAAIIAYLVIRILNYKKILK